MPESRVHASCPKGARDHSRMPEAKQALEQETCMRFNPCVTVFYHCSATAAADQPHALPIEPASQSAGWRVGFLGAHEADHLCLTIMI